MENQTELAVANQGGGIVLSEPGFHTWAVLSEPDLDSCIWKTCILKCYPIVAQK